MNIILNNTQELAKDKILNWYNNINNENSKKIFVLAGYAGTGKSTLINYVIENVLEIPLDKVAFATPTGKAASVLIQKGSEASTVHRLIYTAVEKERSKEINGKIIKTKKIEFIRKKSIGHYKLIVLDEISMISNKIMEDLLSYGIPILATGDIAQLPPVMADKHDLLDFPDAILTEIVRQAEDNSIIRVATMARNNIYIADGNYGNDVTVLHKEVLTESQYLNILLSADQVICGKNSTRNNLNQVIRRAKGYTSMYPEDGEKIICNLNNYETPLSDDKYVLVNGMIGEVKNYQYIDTNLLLSKISFKPDFLEEYTDNIVIDTGIFLHGEFLYEKHQRAYLMSDGSYKIPGRFMSKQPRETTENYNARVKRDVMIKRQALIDEMINMFDYAYVVSCHKFQGSEADFVVVIDESNSFPAESAKWLYTAITRAKKKLIIIR